MAQILKGTTYTTGDSVTAANINAHVDAAILLPGAIGDQVVSGALVGADTILVNKSGGLVKATVSQVADAVEAENLYIKRDGSLAMTADLPLVNSLPAGDLSAASKGYVNAQDAIRDSAIAGKVAKSGDTMTGALTLPGNPVNALEAAPKQYVEQYANQQDSTLVPTGAIMPFYRSSAPSGWLECNGQSTSGYPALAALVGSNVPDLRGEFIRGWDNGRGVDPSRAIGKAQAQDIQPHTHSISLVAGTGGTAGIFYQNAGTTSPRNTGSAGGTETRPRNIALMFCIKA